MKVWYEMVGASCGSRHHRRDHDDDHHVAHRSRDHDDHHNPHQYFFAKVHRQSPFGHPEHPSGHGMGHGLVHKGFFILERKWKGNLLRSFSLLNANKYKYQTGLSMNENWTVWLYFKSLTFYTSKICNFIFFQISSRIRHARVRSWRLWLWALSSRLSWRSSQQQRWRWWGSSSSPPTTPRQKSSRGKHRGKHGRRRTRGTWWPPRR